MITPLKSSLYRNILQSLHNMSPSLDPASKLALHYENISFETLRAICDQQCQLKTKKLFFMHHLPSTVEKYYQRYRTASSTCEPPGFLVRLALEFDISPTMLCRIILQEYLKMDGGKVRKKQLNQLLKDTSLISDGILSREVQICVLNDEFYGPYADAAKRSMGHEYECKIRKSLQEKNIPFLEESHMRANGYDKTPDFLLEIPFATNGFIINWIESKASFGDKESHQTYLKEQFWSYWNRFGPGVVIYWFGYIEELDVDRQKGIVLHCDFPSDIVYMNPTSVA